MYLCIAIFSAGEAPAVLEGLPDLTIREGDNTVFECKLSGVPTPTIKWYAFYSYLYMQCIDIAELLTSVFFY